MGEKNLAALDHTPHAETPPAGLLEGLFRPVPRLGVPGFYAAVLLLWWACSAAAAAAQSGSSRLSLAFAAPLLLAAAVRPAGEIPLALIALSTLSSEEAIFPAALIVCCRYLIGRELRLKRTAASRALVIFGFGVLLSSAVGYLTVELRPLQTAFWCITFFFPLLLQFFSIAGRRRDEFLVALRFGAAAAVLQVPIIAIQRAAAGDAVRPDLHAGTWMNANTAGYWGTLLGLGCAIYLLKKRSMRQSLRGERRLWLACAACAAALTVYPDAKAYSGSLVLAGIAVAIAAAARLVPRSYLHTAGGAAAAAAVVFGCWSLAEARWEALDRWARPLVENSRKFVFLRRVFVEMPREYHPLFGVGPGMLGSRAANAVSTDILFKEEARLPDAVSGSPRPERWGMAGLWDRRLAESIRWTSATLVMPFSGLAALKGELGWIGLALFALLIASMAGQRFRALVEGRDAAAAAVLGALAVALLGNGILCVFDTVWEMPKIMLLLGALSLALPEPLPETAP